MYGMWKFKMWINSNMIIYDDWIYQLYLEEFVFKKYKNTARSN